MKNTTRKLPNPIPAGLQAMEEYYTDTSVTDSGLLVRANKIVALMKPKLGTEFALLIDDGPGALTLMGQHGVLIDAEKDMVAGRKLRQFAVHSDETDDSTNALRMPFMRAPFDNEEQRDAFTELLSAELPVHDIEIGPIIWRLNTVSPTKH